MLRYFKLQKIFIVQYLKQLMEYKTDFVIGIIGVFLTQALNIAFLWIIFSKIPSLYGWTLTQIAFIYGFSLIPKGIDHLLFDNLWNLGKRIIRNGQFDKYMLRPISPLFQVLIETFQLDACGELIIGIALLIKTGNIVHWSLWKAVLFIIAIPFATLIYTSIKIIAASIAFWSKQSGSLMYIFYMLNNFAKYPVSIYNGTIRIIISFIIPFAFTAFYPASFFLTGNKGWFNIGGLITISILLFTLSLLIWHKGISVYESSGS